MPKHATEEHLPIDDTITIDSKPYITGEAIVWFDSKDSAHKRYRMYESALVLQYWDGMEWKDE